MTKRKSIAALFSILFLMLGASSHAADYPERPINVIVPIPAGSAADGIARIVFPAMEKVLGQPMVIENIGGAAHIPGMARAAKPEKVKEKLFTTLIQVLAMPAVIEALRKTDTEVWTSKSPKEFGDFLTAERARYGKLVEDIGLKKQ